MTYEEKKSPRKMKPPALIDDACNLHWSGPLTDMLAEN
jgi:hypothetical protein